ncbi:FGGY-family carbohydrate kinase [Aneurinibacillus migulanus]|uniref:Carbohydrate kinase n=1 Tax=Aneurinibacillus migulanus TaxID=47500 RepID=A0A0D1UUN8_ANEMI|nr:FGGY-family carbohydrate kinase [Aneurinibacillus migulanus]KIV50714.1 carbohydrate kinase [Aneurinibacillus migulanus]KON99364.1 carbohydrate kinase [Aneurinibacillus migulanus]MED0893181.1 carbohydrate kinase [Aneurinibacillus migulanus]MED1615514.1 carbohydrate kinase [Aneurinibacillus migulanus]SDI54261.1 L-xylulokinase [Aneurinibacillus migulanus]
MSKYLLGIDNGGTVTKAALYTIEGKEVAVSSKKTKMLMPQPGHTERDIEGLWQANVTVIKDVLHQSQIDPSLIEGIAITGHGNGLYLVDKDGNPTYNGIISTDTRAKKYIDEWYKDERFLSEVLPKTMQSMWAGQPVALLAWLKEHHPDAVNNAEWIFMVKDLIRYRLTGEAYSEITDMSGTNLLNVKDKKYDEELLHFFGIRDVFQKLPPLKSSTDICGYVTKEAAHETGLQEGTPIAGGIFDIAASAIATGLIEENKLCIVAGTWSINEYITKKPVIDKELFMTSIYCASDYWLTTEASPTSASNLEWFINQFLEGEKSIAKSRGISIYDLCNEMVADTKPEESDVIFFPFLFGSNTVANATSCFIGLNNWHEKKHLLRAVYEGIVFGHMYHIERLLQYRDQPTACRIAGGVTNSDVWLQMFADCLQLPLEIVEVKEHGTLGTAMCAGVATKHFSSIEEAASKIVKIKQVIEPKPEQEEMYKKKYDRFKKIMKAMEHVWSI